MRTMLMVGTALLVSACSMAPADKPVSMPVPHSWPSGDAYAADARALPYSPSFREVFRDARLQQLIVQALANNRDLRIALANVRAARARYQVQRADQFPQIDGSIGVDRSKPGNTGTSNNARPRTTYSAQLGLSVFELDLFGRLASLSRAEQNRYLATDAASRMTRLAMAGDIADAWLDYGADASLMAIAEQTAGSARQSLGLTRERAEAGVAPMVDLRQAEQIVAAAEADLARQRTALAQDINAIELLVGAPIDRALLPASIEDAGATIADLPAGLDSRVLLRRPDVIEAEYRLRAANAEIGAARAALFPQISLTGLLGFASRGLSSLFTSGAYRYSGAADATYSIFRAGAGKANVRRSEAERDTALATYERAIQTAFRDVADGLARRGTIDDETAAVARQVDAASQSYDLADQRYAQGIDGFLPSLVAQRSLYTARRDLVAIRREGASNRVALYRSLGGDAHWN